MSEPLLDVSGLSLAFGGLKAVTDFSLKLHQGELQALIGPNGAGKTTIFNLLTGVYRPQQGEVRLGGRLLNGLPTHKIAASGMARTFQNIRLFGDLTVLDNVRIACHLRARAGLFSALLRTPAHVAEEAAIREKAMALLEVFSLADRHAELSRNLPYGDQRRLEIARALGTEPKVLLLDEPAAGMNPQEKVALSDLITLVRHRFGVTVLLIEHDMALVMKICERITVIEHGVTIASGSPLEVQGNPAVIEAYLGAPSAEGH